MISEECNDNWVDMAMADETIVANLLLSLNNNNNNNENNDSPSLQNLHWTVRKRRTTWHTPNTAAAKKTESAARASPTTPLSWSAATSASGAADGSEDSSRPTNKPVVALDASRSKVQFHFFLLFIYFWANPSIFHANPLFFVIIICPVRFSAVRFFFFFFSGYHLTACLTHYRVSRVTNTQSETLFSGFFCVCGA